MCSVDFKNSTHAAALRACRGAGRDRKRQETGFRMHEYKEGWWDRYSALEDVLFEAQFTDWNDRRNGKGLSMWHAFFCVKYDVPCILLKLHTDN